MDARSASLPREQRIRRRAEFVRLQSAPAVRARGPGFLMLASPQPGESDAAPRAGFVASKKVGNAVQRNRAKRLLRELFRAHKDILPRGFDVIFIAFAGLPEAKLPALEQGARTAFRELAQRAGRLARPDPRIQAARSKADASGGARPRGPREVRTDDQRQRDEDGSK